MNELKIFENPEFGKIRTIEINGEPGFVGKDVAVVLGYAKPENAIATHVDEEDKTTTLIQGDGSNYKSKTTIINESGLYSLVLCSKLPTAKKFKRWVTSEVLPSIRKTGSYALIPQDYPSALRALADAEEKRLALEAENERQKQAIEENGKVLFCGSDVAKALGYSNPRDALRRHCKGVVKRDTLTEGGPQQLSFISEGDIYRLAAKSELPGAERFESWIFDEVLPSVRKSGRP